VLRLSDIRHQERAVSILRRALRSGRMPHAYLFSGPAGVGKETAARALAARLLCGDEKLPPEADACGRCPSCHLMATDNHPDFHLIYRGLHRLHPDPAVRARRGLFLGVDLVRHFVIEPAGTRPTHGRRRVFLFREAERMNEEAQNALLKTLEEPPGAACLILVTSSAERLLPTIRSRCQHVPFGHLPLDYVAQELSARCNLDTDDARALAAISDGRLGVALEWHRLGVLSALEVVAECLERLPAGDVEMFGKTLVELATQLAERGRRADREEADDLEPTEAEDTGSVSGSTVPTDELRDALKLVLALVAALQREALINRLGAAEVSHLHRLRRRAAAIAAAVSALRIENGVQAVVEAERMLDANVSPQLVCERLGVALLGERPV